MNVADKFSWLRAVMADPSRTLASVLVGGCIADHTNLERGAAWPAERTIATWARLDRRNVQRGLEALIAGGFLKVVERGGPRRSTRYCLSMDAVARPQRPLRDRLSGRSGAASADVPERPEQEGKRSENEANLNATLARGGSATAAPPARRGSDGQQKTRRPRRSAPAPTVKF